MEEIYPPEFIPIHLEIVRTDELLPLDLYIRVWYEGQVSYTHSVNVFILVLGTVYHLGYKEPDLLKDIGFGALMHDIGNKENRQGDTSKARPPGSGRENGNRKAPPIFGRDNPVHRIDLLEITRDNASTSRKGGWFRISIRSGGT